MKKSVMKDGVYTAQAMGFVGAVPVRVTVRQGRIDNVEVLPNKESDTFIMYPVMKYPPIIKKYQTLDIDTITGATFCSRAILKAVADCVRQAGGDPEAMRRVPGPPRHPQTVTERTCDVCVIGTGGSGCSAAAMAAERGAKVIVLEKGIFIGGITAGANCLMNIGSRIQKAAGVEVDMKAMYDVMMHWNHYFGNSRLLSRFLHETGPAIDWLEDKGIGMEYTGKEQVTNPFDCTVHFVNFGDMNSHRRNMQTLLDFALDRGGEIFYEARAQELLRESGRVSGARAVLDDGSTLLVRAGAVIVATGGYGMNPELAEKNFTFRDRLCMPAWMAYGDGFNMCVEAGAKTRDLGARVIHVASPEIAKFTPLMMQGNMVPAALSAFPAIPYVNYRGRRFMDEYTVHNSVGVGNALAAQGDYGDALTIFSEGVLERLERDGAAAFNLDATPGGFFGGDYTVPGYFKSVRRDMQAYIDADIVVKADTLAELAEKLGMDPAVLTAEIERYNGLCRAGADTDYFKEPQYLHEIVGAPYYAMRISTYGMGSVGGVMIDDGMQVLDTEQRPIPGLFAAGSCAGGIWGRDSYGMIEGCTCSWAFTSGRMAGHDAAGYALEKKAKEA